MPAPQASEDLYRTLQEYQLLLLAAGRRLWSGMRPDDLDGSWQRIAPQMTAFAAGAQLVSAEAGTVYVPRVLEETGQQVQPLVQIVPAAFAGVASDGRSLPGLLSGAVVNTKRAVARGMDGGDALRMGRAWLDQALQSAVEDAARDATQAAVAARPGLSWVRVVNPPCCSRCAVLAGRTYSWNASFQRHPRCDCLALPVTVANADDYRTNVAELVRRGDITDLTADQRRRLSGGADLPRVLNESRDSWRQRLAADKRAERKARENWGPRGTTPPPGATIHDLFGRLTSQVDAAQAMRAAGIAT